MQFNTKCPRVTCGCCLFTELALRRCNRDTWRTTGLDLTRHLQLVKPLIQSLHVLKHMRSLFPSNVHCTGYIVNVTTVSLNTVVLLYLNMFGVSTWNVCFWSTFPRSSHVQPSPASICTQKRWWAGRAAWLPLPKMYVQGSRHGYPADPRHGLYPVRRDVQVFSWHLSELQPQRQKMRRENQEPAKDKTRTVWGLWTFNPAADWLEVDRCLADVFIMWL